MRTNNWKKVSKVLADCLEIETSQRLKFLKNINPEIRAEVESFLAFEEEAEDFMSLPAKDFSVKFMSEEEIGQNPLIGLKIGAYEILEEIGIIPKIYMSSLSFN